MKQRILLAVSLTAVLITSSAMGAAESKGGNQDEDDISNTGAAGDVTDTSVVLWARSDVLGKAKFKVVARDRKHATKVEHASVSDPLVPVNVKISGLRPATRYEYRISMRDSDIA